MNALQLDLDPKFHQTLTVKYFANFLRTYFFACCRPISAIYYMNDLYNETIVRNGKIYHYDPDMDIYYCRYSDETTASKYAWIVVTLVLCAIVYYVEYLK